MECIHHQGVQSGLVPWELFRGRLGVGVVVERRTGIGVEPQEYCKVGWKFRSGALYGSPL